MIKISQGQMSAFSKHAKREFVRRTAIFAKRSFTKANSYTAEEVLLKTEVSVERAEGYGLRSKRQILTYVSAVFTLGERFEDQDEDMRRTLNSSLPAEEKSTILALWLEKRLPLCEEGKPIGGQVSWVS